MKRLLVLLLCGVLLLAGCAPDAPAPTETTGGSIDKLTLTLVTAGRFGDGGIADSIKAGCGNLPGVTLKTMECGGKNHTDHLLAAAMEADLVVLVGEGFEELETIAPDFQNVRFILVDGATEKSVPNVLTVAFARNESAFLAGYAAARSSGSGILAIVCGEGGTAEDDLRLGFSQGAKYADPNVTIQVCRAGDREPADSGADVIYYTGSGEVKQAGTLCAVVTDGGTAIAMAVEKYMTDGKNCPLFGTTWLVELSSGLVRVDCGGLPDELAGQINDLKKKIAARIILVDSAR